MTVTLFLVLHIRQLYSRTETVVSHCAVHPSNANTREALLVFFFLSGMCIPGGASGSVAGLGKENFPPKTFFRAQMKN